MKEQAGDPLSGFAIDSDEDALTVDLSEFVTAQGGMREIKWARPDVPSLYQVGPDALAIQNKFPGMPDQMALEVSLMAHCHIAANGHPKTGETLPAMFYGAIGMSKKHGKMWMLLSSTMRTYVPDAWSFLTGAGDLKKILLTLRASASSTPIGTPES